MRISNRNFWLFRTCSDQYVKYHFSTCSDSIKSWYFLISYIFEDLSLSEIFELLKIKYCELESEKLDEHPWICEFKLNLLFYQDNFLKIIQDLIYNIDIRRLNINRNADFSELHTRRNDYLLRLGIEK